MIDLNHGSGCNYGQDAPRPPIAAAVSSAIDAALTARNRAERPRTYVSSSGLGRDCLRQIQYDFLAVPKDEGQEFAPKTLRIFEAEQPWQPGSARHELHIVPEQGHSLANAWRAAGVEFLLRLLQQTGGQT